MLAQYMLSCLLIWQAALAASVPGRNGNQKRNGGGGGPGHGGGGGGGGSGWKGQTYLATFDDLANPSPVAIVPVNQYEALDWNSFFLITQYTGTGFIAESAPNTAGYGVYGEILQGQPQLTPLDSSATFDLTSFYLSCAQNSAETAVALPRACSVTVTGYKGSSVVATQLLSFTPTALLTTTMQYYQLSGAFKGLTKVVFANTPNDITVATLFDNVKYTVYTKK